jgi:amino acid adenylation domain-containing protein
LAVYEFPASFGQRRMWLLAEMDPGEPTYNIAWAVWLDGPLDTLVLQQAWDAALVRHEALRTTFRNDSGVPVQVIEEDPGLPPLPVTSLEHLPEGEREPAARDLIGKLARIPFDVATGPLAHAALVRLSPRAHVLAVVMHHIVADGWSLRLLFDELSTDYEAIGRGGQAAGEPPIQYADFAMWQIEHAEDGGFAPAGRFWRAELADLPAALPLPVDAPYPARQTFAAERIETTLDEDLAGALRKLAAKQGTTLFAVLLAAYAVVLARLTGSDDLLIGVPMAARTRPESESVVGLFMNTVPIRLRVDTGATIGDLVQAAHAATARAMEHQELPFARMVELARPERDPARMPLVQVMFAMEESWAMPDRGGLRWHPEQVSTGTAMFEVELTVTDTPAGPGVRVIYNRDLFHQSVGQLVADGYTAILRRLCDDPDQSVADVQIMPPDTLALVTKTWPDGGQVADPGATALAMLWAACAGDAVVATGTDGTLTGAGVRAQAQRITAALRGQGVAAGDRVAILLPRGARLLPAILGVWSAGASYVPMDPIYPDQRLATMLADADAAAILVDSAGEGAVAPPPTATPVPVVDLAVLAAVGQGAAEPLLDLPPSATAVTLFTSGSTGRPKAVSVTQGGIATLLTALRPMLALTPEDRFVATTTFAFDIALVELLAPVLAGGCVVVADAEHTLDAARRRELLAESGATATQATPAGWRMLIDAGGIPAGVKLRMTAGEPLPRDLADVMGAGSGVRLWNLYGPTETTIYSGGDAVAPGPAPIEIGSIIAGTQLYILDEDLRPVPPGVYGEVYIGGAGVANGYHGVPGLTAARFVPDPYGGRPGARLYRSGDVGRWRESGRIELAGRADRQIKIRGYRVESGEVEATLRACDGIEQAVVSLRGKGHDARLVGYLVTRSGVPRPPAGLREHLREVLPDYMVPASFVVLPELPHTSNGKVDYAALPEPDWGAPPDQVPVAPRTPEESRLAAMITELLELPRQVGVSDNFFALGGHSLTATRLMARIRTVYGVDLTIRTFFSDPTVAGLADALAAAGGRAGPLSQPWTDPGGPRAGQPRPTLAPADER